MRRSPWRVTLPIVVALKDRYCCGLPMKLEVRDGQGRGAGGTRWTCALCGEVEAFERVPN